MNSKRSIRALFLATAAAALVSTSAAAQIVNGDFESGGVGWTISVPPGWFVAFTDISGNPGIARISDPDSTGGLGCISQEFVCGTPGPSNECVIELDFVFVDVTPDSPTRIARAGGFNARLKVFVDGGLIETSEATSDWEHVRLTVPCGQHEIAICNEVDFGYKEMHVDNVTAQCESPTSVDSETWGRVKSLYR